MLVFIITYPRTGGMILCEALGQHSELIALNEVQKWKAILQPNKSYVIKPTYWEIRNSKLIEDHPDAKFISINRNKLDIAASYKGIEMQGTDTRTRLLRPVGDRSKTYYAAAEQYLEFRDWRSRLESWPNFLVIEFEDMINKKMETFEKIFKFLDVKFELPIKEYINKYIFNEVVKNYPLKAHSASPRKKVGSHKDLLTEEEINKINLLT